MVRPVSYGVSALLASSFGHQLYHRQLFRSSGGRRRNRQFSFFLIAIFCPLNSRRGLTTKLLSLIFCPLPENREPRLAPILDKLNGPLQLPSSDSGQSRQLQADCNRLSADNAGERPNFFFFSASGEDNAIGQAG